MDQEIISLHVGELDVILVVKLGTLLVNNRCFNLHSKASLAAQGLSEKDILDEQVKGEALLKELSELKVR